jgi:hypothetical protein
VLSDKQLMDLVEVEKKFATLKWTYEEVDRVYGYLKEKPDVFFREKVLAIKKYKRINIEYIQALLNYNDNEEQRIKRIAWGYYPLSIPNYKAEKQLKQLKYEQCRKSPVPN